MSERQDDRPTPEGEDPGTPRSEEPVRSTDGQRWQASVASWPVPPAGQPDGGTALDAAGSPDDGTAVAGAGSPDEVDGGAAAPAAEPSEPARGSAPSWEQPAWEQPAWLQPAWLQPAQPGPGAGWSAPGPAATPGMTPAATPAWGQPGREQPGWEQRAWEQPSWEQPARPPTPAWEQPAWQQAPQVRPEPTRPQAARPEPARPEPTGPEPARPAYTRPAVAQRTPAGPHGVPVSGGPAPGGPAPAPERPGPPPSLTSQTLLRARAEAPSRGWRRFVHKASGGTYNPGLSAAELQHRALVSRVTTPVRGSNRIAVVSLKGGIGKTTTTSCLGLTLAHHRGDRVVAVDANPDAGTLAERLTNVIDVTVRDLLAAIDSIRSFTDVSAFTSLAGRLQVLASDQDPALSEAFSEVEYRAVADILARYFNIILTDSGTGLLHSAMSGTLAIADSLVVVGAPSVDGASRASKTLDWLIAHGHEELVARSVAVISSVRPNTGDVDMDLLRQHFESRCRAVIEIPYDSHLVTGGLIDLAQVGAPAQQAYLELAAAVADGFALAPLQRSPLVRA